MTKSDDAASPQATIAAALAAQTTAQKAIASAEIPLLKSAQAVLSGPEVEALEAALKPIADALSPGNSATMIRHILQFIDGARQALPGDLVTRQRTLAS